MQRTPSLLLLLFLMACAHSEPATSGPGDLDVPFEPGVPLRLTWSLSSDHTPAWSFDPARVLYAYEGHITPQGRQGCVSDLPIVGGSRGVEACEVVIDTIPRQTRIYWPARRVDGVSAFMRQEWRPGFLSPTRNGLVMRGAGAIAVTRTIIPIPYFSAASGRSHQGISHLQWLDRDHLIFVGQGVIRSTNDNVESGYEIMILAPDDSIAGLTLVPGTNYASSVDVGGTSDTIYYTLGGDSLVYRRTLSTGAVDTVANFGSLGIVRDVRVRAGKLVAVVGGNVTFGPHPTLGMAQYDLGGPLHAMGLPGGTPAMISSAFDLYRHPALSPDGSRVVAEQAGDLWAVAVP
jgi:hypothetical protein